TERGKSPVNDLNTILNGLAAIVTIIGGIVGAITFFSKFIKKRPETLTILTGSHPSTRQIEPNAEKFTEIYDSLGCYSTIISTILIGIGCMISTNFWWILGFIFFGISILFYSLGFNFAQKLGPPYDSDQAPGYIIAFIGISLVVVGFITSATFLLIP